MFHETQELQTRSIFLRYDHLLTQHLQMINLVDSLRWSHRTFDVQRSDVLPVLLQQRHQKVN